jgi:hypothetical protein
LTFDTPRPSQILHKLKWGAREGGVLFGSKHPTFDPMAIQTTADAVGEARAIMKATGT